MKATVQWKGNRLLDGVADSGHHVLMDGPVQFGGQDAGVRPMELLLLGLGGCTGFDVISILQKKRVSVADFRIELTAERAEEHPKIFKKIRIHFVVVGRDIPESAVERAIQLSEEKFCSASAMLKAVADIETTWEIVQNPGKLRKDTTWRNDSCIPSENLP